MPYCSDYTRSLHKDTLSQCLYKDTTSVPNKDTNNVKCLYKDTTSVP